MISSDLYPWLQVVRLCLAGLAAALIVTTAVVAARTERLHAWGLALGVLFAAEMVFGLRVLAAGLNDGVAATYSVLAVALLWCLGMLTAVAGTSVTPPDADAQRSVPDRGDLAE